MKMEILDWIDRNGLYIIGIGFCIFAIILVAGNTYVTASNNEVRVRELYRHPDLIPEIHEVGFHYAEVNLMVEDYPVYLVQVSKTNLSDEYDGKLFNIYVDIESEYVYWELG